MREPAGSRAQRPGWTMQRAAEQKLATIERALGRHAPHLYRPGGQDTGLPPPAMASVALVVRPEGPDLEVLLIRRAIVPGDPWSGHMALPGGRRSRTDANSLETAIRETGEEVGVDLREHGLRLGRLDDVQPGPGAPRIVVSPYVFAVPAGTRTRTNYEVDLAVWIPLRHLVEPGATTHYLHALASGESLRFPAFGYQEHVIWGLTYRIVFQFLDIARSAVTGGDQWTRRER